ncbi:MAG: hypothetical protein IJ574_03700 [Bacilli bacterium]|nr:hypothetical protein [Bacilli bacterium]
MIVNIIICLIIIVVGVLAILTIYNKHKLEDIIKRLDYSKDKLDKNLDDKKELIEKAYKEIKDNYLKEKSYYQDIIKEDLINFDKELTTSNNTLNDLINDNDKIKEDKSIKQITKDIKANDEKIYALKTYYNDNILAIKKSQNNIINKLLLTIKKKKDFNTFEI